MISCRFLNMKWAALSVNGPNAAPRQNKPWRGLVDISRHIRRLFQHSKQGWNAAFLSTFPPLFPMQLLLAIAGHHWFLIQHPMTLIWIYKTNAETQKQTNSSSPASFVPLRMQVCMNFVTNFTNSSKNACLGLPEEDFSQKERTQSETPTQNGRTGW